MARFEVGVGFESQRCTVTDLHRARREADVLGVDSICTWDRLLAMARTNG